MSRQLHANLDQLHALRERSRDQAQQRLAEQQRLCERIAGTVSRLEMLADSAAAAPADGRLTATLLANQAAYKDRVLDLARGQRQALASGQAAAATARAELMAEVRREAALAQARDQVGERLARDARRQEQKLQDAVAAQSWQRGGRA